MKISIASLSLIFFLSANVSADQGALRRLGKPPKPDKPPNLLMDHERLREHGDGITGNQVVDPPGKRDQLGPPGGHPNQGKGGKSDHEPKNNRCPKQSFPECEDGGAFGTDTCIACCECECDDTGNEVKEAKAKCEFEGEEDSTEPDKTCATYDMVDYDDIGGDCTSTCAGICTTTTQPSIQVTNPIGQGSVSGMLNLQVDITDPTNSIHSVQYLVNDEAIETTAVAPYNVDWHSINVFDGIVSLKVIALDIQGEDVTSSDTVMLHVSNHDGYSFSNTSPEFEATVSGDMVMSTLISNTMNDYPDYWPDDQNLVMPDDWYTFLFAYMYIDGELYDTFAYTDDTWQYVCDTSGCHTTAAFTVDTTKLSNGWHGIMIRAEYDFDAERHEKGAMYLRVNVQNDSVTLIDVQPKFATVYLSVGESQAITMKSVFNDLSEQEYTGQTAYSLSDFPPAQSIVTLDSSGLVTALALGRASITCTSQEGYSHAVRIIINEEGFPHYSKSGVLLTEYTPGESVFMRGLFQLRDEYLVSTYGLPEQVEAASINTIESGLHKDVRDGRSVLSWKSMHEGWWLVRERFFEQYQRCVSTHMFGDDTARYPYLLVNSLSPYAVEPIAWAVDKAAESQHTNGIDMVDEVSMIWGDNPNPDDGRFDGIDIGNGETFDFGDNAFLELMNTINSAESRDDRRPPISWPVMVLDGGETAANWMGDSRFSDYASLNSWPGFHPEGPSRHFYNQLESAIEVYLLDGKLPFVNQTKPMLGYISSAGPWFQKNGPGEDYVDGQDSILADGFTPKLVSSFAAALVAQGMSGIKSYKYGYIGEGSKRQTGSSPFASTKGSSSNWQALSTIFNLIGDLEEYIIAEHVTSPWLGSGISTGLKQSSTHYLLMAVSLTEIPLQIQFPLDLYLFQSTEQTEVVLYSVLGGTSSVTQVSSESSVTRDILPGEALFWLFRPRTADVVPSIMFVSPAPDLTVRNDGIVSAEVIAEDATSVDFYMNGSLLSSVSGIGPSYVFDFPANLKRAEIWHSLSAVATNDQGGRSQARTKIFIKCANGSCDDDGCPVNTVARGMECVSEEINTVMLTSDITIDAGEYQGTYSVKGMTGCCVGPSETYSQPSSGSRTVSIQYTQDASRQWSRLVYIRIGEANFYFSLDTTGKIVRVSNPHVAEISQDGMTLTLNSVFISINPGNYAGSWTLSGYPLQQGSRTLAVVPYMFYHLALGVNRYMIDVGSSGTIELAYYKHADTLEIHGDNWSSRDRVNVSPNIGTLDGGTITFTTKQFTVNPRNLNLSWKIVTPENGMGTVDLIPSSTYTFRLDMWGDLDPDDVDFEIDEAGNLIEPLAWPLVLVNGEIDFQLTESTLTLDPGLFRGKYVVPGINQQLSPVTLTVISSMSYEIVGYGYSSFFFDLNETGGVVAVRDSDYNVVDEIASYNATDGTLSFRTNTLTIDVGEYTGYYTLGGHTADFTSERGSLTADLVPALEYRVTQSQENYFSLKLNHTGHVSSVLNQDGDAVDDVFGAYDESSRTFFITTYPMAIEMGNFIGRWNVYMITTDYTEESGDLTVNFIPSFEYQIGYAYGGGRINFSLDESGHIVTPITNDYDESIDGPVAEYNPASRSLSIRSFEYVIAAGSYDGGYHVNGVSEPYTFVEGDQSFYLIPGAKYTIAVGWFGHFDVEIDNSGHVVAIYDETGNSAGEIATYSSSTSETATSRTLSLQTVPLSIEVGDYVVGRYSVFGITGELQGDAQLVLLPSIEYGVNLGQGYASKNTYVFSLDSDGNVTDQSPIASYSSGVLSLNSHLVNINSACSQSYAINWVLDDTVGNAAIYLLSTVNYKLKIDSTTIEFAVDAYGSSLTVQGDGLSHVEVSGSSMTFKSCLCNSSC